MLIQVLFSTHHHEGTSWPKTGIPSRVRSFVYGDNINQLVATSTGNFVIQAVDKLERPRTSGNLDLSISVKSVFVPGQDLPILQSDQNVFWELFNVGNGMYILYFRVNVACTVRFSINIQDPPGDGQPSPAARILLEPQIVILPGINWYYQCTRGCISSNWFLQSLLRTMGAMFWTGFKAISQLQKFNILPSLHFSSCKRIQMAAKRDTNMLLKFILMVLHPNMVNYHLVGKVVFQ